MILGEIIPYTLDYKGIDRYANIGVQSSTKPCYIEIIPPPPKYTMASIKATWSLVPFTMPLTIDGSILIWENLMGLRFNFQMNTMYVEHELFNKSGWVSKIVFMQKN